MSRTDCYSFLDYHEPMVTNDEKQLFSKRLNLVLDKAGIPPKGKGRQGILAKMFGVSDKGARKWIEGESIPSTTKLPVIVKKFKDTGVTVEWLLSGDPEKLPIQTNNELQKLTNLSSLMSAATPRTHKALEAIEQAWKNGTLTEEDLNLLDTIARRLADDKSRSNR